MAAGGAKAGHWRICRQHLFRSEVIYVNVKRIPKKKKAQVDKIYRGMGLNECFCSIIAGFMSLIFLYGGSVFKDPRIDSLIILSLVLLSIFCLWDGIAIIHVSTYYAGWIHWPSPRWLISKTYRTLYSNRERIYDIFRLNYDAAGYHAAQLDLLKRNKIEVANDFDSMSMLMEMRDLVRGAPIGPAENLSKE